MSMPPTKTADRSTSVSPTIRGAVPSPELQPLLQPEEHEGQRSSIEKNDNNNNNNEHPLPSYSPSVHSDDIWVTGPEDLQPTNGTPAIRLQPTQEEQEQQGSANTCRWSWQAMTNSGRCARLPNINNINVRPENRGIVADIKQGLLLLATTPIAFSGMVLYATGLVIEGIALLMKGVGSFGARMLVRRANMQASDPVWV
ncbi:hypothetical protein D9613_009109 [Agrocybe pediades]|uniref:Uncharacterized protein n=1 Tax=Agrocybe pediades TaxID=84607 RepID=A0A8H4R5B1_9AGAR|nr:hypothetical protein D9613_009109 [Agrocybe pediades]